MTLRVTEQILPCAEYRSESGVLMSRGRKKDARCEECLMRFEICICKEIAECRSKLDVQTRVVILMHHRERHLTTNTARLAARIMPRTEIRMRGFKDTPLNTAGIIEEDRQALLLYPSDKAEELGPDYMKHITKPVTLIVPDGSWRQASKVAKREPFLKDVPHVTLPNDAPTFYQLRREPKSTGLATFEAIARALGWIESPHIRSELEKVFRIMVQRTVNSRLGVLSCEDYSNED
jgi:DTW domain-containing protein YfiP